MKITALYAALAVVGVTAVALVPLTMYRSGSPALPAWRAAVSPGPLSSAHAFLRTQCESCHVPDRGIEAAACLTCHTFASGLLAKQDTAFHATIGECATCHVEHTGGDRPIRMDHGALVAAGAADRPDPAGRGGLAALERLLNEASTALGPPGAALSAKQAGRLDCASCHAVQDRHRSRFGASCQSCHVTANWAVAGWQHPSPRSTDCAQCHQAPPSHRGEHFLGMSQRVATRRPDRIEQCYLCHQTNSFHSFGAAGPAEHR
jgi:hypothetical protein